MSQKKCSEVFPTSISQVRCCFPTPAFFVHANLLPLMHCMHLYIFSASFSVNTHQNRRMRPKIVHNFVPFTFLHNRTWNFFCTIYFAFCTIFFSPFAQFLHSFFAQFLHNFLHNFSPSMMFANQKLP